MNGRAAVSEKFVIKRYRSPKTAIARFVTKRTVRPAAIWALVFGGYVASKAIGFVDVYPTEAARQKIAETFSSNIGVELLLGRAPHDGTTAAYAAWNTAGVMVVIGGIWALLLATKYFRGEEDSGRWEMLLSGQTTARRAVLNTFAGFGASLGVFYAVMAALFILVGKARGVDFNASASFFFALVVILGITIFLMAGALASQLMPTRGRAASVSATVLGVCFLARAISDVTNAHWLSNLTPLGWVEKLQPLAGSRPVWLIPVIGLILVMAALTVYLAGRRDLGASIIADKDTAKPRTGLLNSPVGAALRLTRGNSAGWLAAVFLSSTLYGLMAKSTAQAFSASAGAEHVLSRLAHQSQVAGALDFLGIAFLLVMILVMAYAASSLAAIRRDEAEGYLDNFLVRPVSRLRWLSGRVLLVMAAIILAGVLTCAGTWVGVASQHGGVPFHLLLMASINALVPVIFTVGAGIFALGVRPRLTSLAAYGVLAWSFLVEMASSGINLNHWIVDTSVLNHIALAPAANPRWYTDLIIVLLAIILGLIGATAFNRRDLESE